MTSRSLFFKLMKEDAKRRLWMIAISVLTFFFSFPVAMAMMCGDYQSYKQDMEWAYNNMLERATNLLTYDNGFVVVLLIAASVLCGVSSFAYLHSKKKVDFYHSLPVRRETFFWVSYVNGILVVAIPYLISILLAAAVMGMNGMSAVSVIPEALEAYLFHMLHFILLYGGAVVAMMMTGNIVIGIMGNMVFCGYFPIVFLLFIGNCSMFLDTFYENRWSVINSVFSRLSPFTEYIYAFSDWNNGKGSTGVVAITVFAAAAVTLLALWLYKIRPSEAAGKAIAFKKTQAIIKILIVIPSAISGMMFFYAMRNSDAWGVFGMICGLLISYCLIEIIYNFDFRKMFSNKIHLAFCAVASICIICIFRFDLLGYDSYLPRADKIENASIYVGSLDNWVDYSKADLYEYGGNKPSLQYNYESDLDYVFENMKVTDIESLLQIAEVGITEAGQYDSSRRYYEEPADSEEKNFFARVYIEYHLKNGKKPVRSYYMDLNKVMEAMDKIYQSKEYKMGVFPLLKLSAEDIAGVNYQELGEVVHVEFGNGDSGKKELLEVYQEELAALSLETREKENPVCLLQFKTNEMQSVIDTLKNAGSSEWLQLNDHATYPVYPSFTKTIGLLKKYGIDAGNEYFKADQIASISLSRYDYGTGMEFEGEQIGITDKEQISEIRGALVWSNYEQMNSLNTIMENVNVTVYLKGEVIKTSSGRNSYNTGFYLDRDKVPEFLIDKLASWE